jgi:hypothetical protein
VVAFFCPATNRGRGSLQTLRNPHRRAAFRSKLAKAFVIRRSPPLNTALVHFPFAFSPSNLDFGAIIAPVQFCYTGRSDIE